MKIKNIAKMIVYYAILRHSIESHLLWLNFYLSMAFDLKHIYGAVTETFPHF